MVRPPSFPVRTVGLLVILGVAQFLYLLPDVFSPVSVYDEGYVVVAAERILRGQYRTAISPSNGCLHNFISSPRSSRRLG